MTKSISIFGAGFIGQSLYQHLSKVCTVRLFSGNKHCSFAQNCAYSELGNDIIEYLARCDRVVIAIGSGDVNYARDHRDVFFDSHYKGLKSLISALGPLSAKVVYLSTDKVFSSSSDADFQKLVQDRRQPINFYGQVKKQCEEFVGNNHASIIRLPAIISSFAHPRNPITRFRDEYLEKGFIEVPKNLGERFFTSTDDLACVIAQNGTLPKVSHFSTNISCSYQGLAEACLKIWNISHPSSAIKLTTTPQERRADVQLLSSFPKQTFKSYQKIIEMHGL